MARQIVVTDDITEEPNAEEVTFAIDGKVYKIDLTQEGEQELRRALGLYIHYGREAGRLTIGSEKANPMPQRRLRGQEADPDTGRHTKEEIDSCREFCEKHGIEISEARGRIPVIVWKAWRTNDPAIVPEHLLLTEPTDRQLKMPAFEAPSAQAS